MKIVIPAGTFKEGQSLRLKASGRIITYPAANRIVQAEAAARAGFVGETMVDGDLGADTGFNITKPIERKLEGFARRLRLFGKAQGATNIGADRWEIQVGASGYTVLSKNGKANPCLEEE